MLSKILYTGYQVLNIDFHVDDTDNERGIFEVKYTIESKDKIFKRFSESPVDDDEGKIMPYPATVQITGYNEDKSKVEFSLKLNIIVYFSIHNSVEITIEFLDHNSWFFDNFVASSIKESATSIFALTKYNNISLPFNRIESS